MIDMSSRVTGIISEKNVDSQVTKCNDVFLKYAGVNSDDKVIGRTDLDFPWQEYAKVYRMHELDAINGNTYSTIIPLKSNKDFMLFMHTKSPRLDHNNKIIGIYCHAVEILNADTAELIHTLSNYSPRKLQSYSFERNNVAIKLSTRQTETLFYLLRGKQTKAIAKIMDLSVRTVEYYISNIKIKFNCHTKSELIDRATELGFLEQIPNRLSARELLRSINDE